MLQQALLAKGLHKRQEAWEFTASLHSALEGLKPQWANALTASLRAGGEAPQWEVTDGIFYLHSYLNYQRLACYFGDWFSPDATFSENIVNQRLWERGSEPLGYTYYHHLHFLASHSPEAPIFLLITFDPQFTTAVQFPASPQVAVLNCPWDYSTLSDTDQRVVEKLCGPIANEGQWDVKCQDLRDAWERGGTFSSARDLLARWEAVLTREGQTSRLNNPWLMFRNIFRYLGFLQKDESAQKVWPLVLYVPEWGSSRQRSGLICNLRPISPDVTVSDLVVSVGGIAQRLSEELLLIASQIHYLELPFFAASAFNDAQSRIAYSERWFCRRIVRYEGSKAAFDPVDADRRTAWETLLASPPGAPEVGKLFDIVRQTLKRLAEPGSNLYATYDTVVHQVTRAVESLWQVFSDGDQSCGNCPLMRLLDRLIRPEEDLRFVPRYREHYVHAFHTLVLGLTFLRPSINDMSLVRVRGARLSWLDFLRCWFLVAVFHDIAYGVEKMESLAKLFYHNVLKAPRAKSVESVSPFGLRTAEFLRDEQLHNYLLRLESSGVAQADCVGQAVARALVDRADHGVLSSYILHANMTDAFESPGGCRGKLCKPRLGGSQWGATLRSVCRAIALHHCSEPHWRFDTSEGPRSGFEDVKWSGPPALSALSLDNTLLMLLILCDSLSQAGRSFETVDGKIATLSFSDIGYDSVDLLYTSNVLSGTKLCQHLQEPGRLEPTEDYSSGGWYAKPADTLKWYMKQSGATCQRCIRVRVFASGADGAVELAMPKRTESYMFPFPVIAAAPKRKVPRS